MLPYNEKGAYRHREGRDNYYYKELVRIPLYARDDIVRLALVAVIPE